MLMDLENQEMLLAVDEKNGPVLVIPENVVEAGAGLK